MPTQPTLIIATANPHKVEELKAILAPVFPNIQSLADLPSAAHLQEPAETGTTFQANARIKAQSYAAQLAALLRTSSPLDPKIPGSQDPFPYALADDSGIEIDALALPDGTPRPGVISSHYSTDGQETGLSRAQRDQANNARVLRELEAVPDHKRTARFVCCMCVADANGHILAESRGTFEGRIGTPPRVPAGTHGFGYDPLFLVAPTFTHTGAELTPEAKNQQSHRAVAARALLPLLASALLT